MALIDKETIRAEIERRIKAIADSPSDGGEMDAINGGKGHALMTLLAFLDTLPEQPVLPGIDEEGIPGRDFIPVDWVDACERYGKWKIVNAEQPVTDHHEIEVEFRGEKVTVNREFYRKEDKNYSTSEQDDNVIWAALRAWCEKKGITAFELYPQQPEQPVEGLEVEAVSYCFDNGINLSPSQAADFARHFYELGQNSCPKISDNSLEEEIEFYLDHAELATKCKGISAAEDYFNDLKAIARHFAEWGAEHAKK